MADPVRYLGVGDPEEPAGEMVQRGPAALVELVDVHVVALEHPPPNAAALQA